MRTVCIFCVASSSLPSSTPRLVRNCLISSSSILKSSSPVMPLVSNCIIMSSASSWVIFPSWNAFNISSLSPVPLKELPSSFIAFFVSLFSGIDFPLSNSQFPVILMLKSLLLIFAPFDYFNVSILFYFSYTSFVISPPISS